MGFVSEANQPLPGLDDKILVSMVKPKSNNPIVDRALQSQDPVIERLSSALNSPFKQSVIDRYRRLPPDLGAQYADFVLKEYRNCRTPRSRAVFQERALNSEFDAFLKKASARQLEIEASHAARMEALGKQISELESRFSSVAGKCGASELEIEGLRKDLEILKQRVADGLGVADKRTNAYIAELDKIRDETRERTGSEMTVFLNEQKDSVGRLTEELKGLLSRATIGVLSVNCDKKRVAEQKSMWWKSAMFYLSLLVLALLGVTMVCCYSSALRANADESVSRWTIFLRSGASYCIPFYIPVIWFACHMNRLTAQSRRLMEEYSHKTVVTQTYTGLSEQIDVLSKKGLESAKELSGNLLSRTISVICTNPNHALDKVKSPTPISEVVDGAARVIAATGKP